MLSGMKSLVITFRDRSTSEIRGPGERIDALAARLREAMGGNVDRVISHDLEGEPKDFLVSDVVHFHAAEGR